MFIPPYVALNKTCLCYSFPIYFSLFPIVCLQIKSFSVDVRYTEKEICFPTFRYGLDTF